MTHTKDEALKLAQEAAKDLEARLTKTEGWLNEAMWNYGELKREQLANSERNKARWYQEGVEAEREVIARSMDKQANLAADDIDRQWAQEMAAAIRARSKFSPSKVKPSNPDPLQLSRILHELAGAASMCWNPRPTGVFDSQEAIGHVVAAIQEIRSRMDT